MSGRIALSCALATIIGCGDDSGPAADAAQTSALKLRVLSSRPDAVTAGDALVEIEAADGTDPAAIVVTADGRDVTSAFGPSTDGKRVGLVEGLALGPVALEAAIPGHAPVRLPLVTYPVTGPMISGPHQTPFVCRTQEAGLGAPLDANCTVAVRYEHYYKNTANQFVALSDPSNVPADVQQVKRADGAMIDYVVRVERGTINRAIYQITVLYDPTQPDWTASSPQPQWTKKLVYGFKGGCGEGHHQGLLNALDDLAFAVYPLGDAAVAAGFAVASASLNTLGTTCNDVISAETAMMVKERFVERYGAPLYTTGWGGSGGSIQQHLIAENYPGVLDGIVPIISYPDIVSVYPDIMDCRLLVDYFNNRAGGRFADTAARVAATGFATATVCDAWNALLGHLEDPTTGCDPAIPVSQIYHPTNNPTGVRCTFADNLVNQLGVDPATGHARRFYDNIGVQYGLAALNAGTITKDQFLHMNETVGGMGPDGVFPAPRSSADPEALRAIYRKGRITRGDLGLSTIPIVDFRLLTDELGDFHDRVRSFTMRDRLRRANGHVENHVMIASTRDATPTTQAGLASLLVIDAWLTALVADPNPDRAAAVRATRPANVTSDFCILPGMDPKPSACEVEYPPHATPRLVAGAPATQDVLKCQLRPLAMADYAVTFTPQEWARLQAIFPDGVCDYTRDGVEQAPADGTWLSFGPHP